MTQAERRGHLRLPDKVVAKIAGQAASEVDAVGGTSGGVLGLGTHTDLDARPRVDVELSGRHVDLEFSVTVAFPLSIRTVCAELRNHVAQRVERLTGLTVGRVDIAVTMLKPGAGSTSPTGQVATGRKLR